ncbi:hypothetical protein Taro_037925 [Colocasia esculenta]|uniref:Remorin C-terminal domain-containing protein n=1 Tax=Colocasia esculenta TaxID=4460 RepID=A0A843WCE3_COLES|nr:hypothetical protein [Colocasia esculenta]
MDVKTPKCLQNLAVFPSTDKEYPLEVGTGFYCNKENPFVENFPDPLCKLNLKETSEFVKAFPVASTDSGRAILSASAQRRRESSARQRRLEAPSTPGRPVFSFSNGNLSRKAVPSKWDDAEKWLIGTSCHGSPAHMMKSCNPPKVSKQNEVFCHKGDAFAEKLRVAEDKMHSSLVTSFHGLTSEAISAFPSLSSEILLKDKFTDNVEPIFPSFQYSEPAKEGFLLRNSVRETMKDATTEVVAHHRDVGTEMTPLGSSTTSRCHTPLKTASPARHNTPADRSGPLMPSDPSIDISGIKECHFAKLDLGGQFDSMVSHWSSREEEEEEISKSLRHFEIGAGRKSIVESRASAWEDEEKSKICVRYQREEAKIQAWVNLQSAKAEAESRKLEVKIQKMRSNLEEKLMKKMAVVHRRAEEWRAAAQLQHSQEISRASEQAHKMKTQQETYLSGHAACGCFPRNNHF